MGQYHIAANLDKKEFIHPHRLGDGLKLLEWDIEGTLSALQMLLAVSSGRGGGDFQVRDSEVIGRWGGDRVAIIGDYAEKGDIASRPSLDAGKIYEQAQDEKGGWKDISAMVAEALETEFDVEITGEGWRTRKRSGEE